MQYTNGREYSKLKIQDFDTESYTVNFVNDIISVSITRRQQCIKHDDSSIYLVLKRAK